MAELKEYCIVHIIKMVRPSNAYDDWGVNQRDPQIVHLLCGYQDRRPVIAEPVRDLLLLEPGDDRTGIGFGQFREQHAVVLHFVEVDQAASFL